MCFERQSHWHPFENSDFPTIFSFLNFNSVCPAFNLEGKFAVEITQTVIRFFNAPVLIAKILFLRQLWGIRLVRFNDDESREII